MTTASDIVHLALKSLLVYGVGETPTDEDAADGLTVLNRMIVSWQNESVDVLWTTVTASDTFSFWVPPVTADGDTINAVAYQGTWNASTNTPALASAAGTDGYVYKVSTAGTTTLDGLSSWAVGDYLVYDGSQWRKGRTSQRFEQAVIAMLGVRLSSPFSVPIPPELARTADDGWRQIQAEYTLAATPIFDPALTRLPSRRWAFTSSGSGIN